MKKRAIIFLLSLLKATMLYDSYSSFASFWTSARLTNRKALKYESGFDSQ